MLQRLERVVGVNNHQETFGGEACVVYQPRDIINKLIDERIINRKSGRYKNKDTRK
jgi:hypothetical protein